MAAVAEMEETMNLLHQPSSYDSEEEEEEEETLSLRDIPLTTASTSSSRSIAWNDEQGDRDRDHHDYDQDVFEFFSGDFNPSSSTTSHDEAKEEKESIIFCGKIIPHRKPHQGNNNNNNNNNNNSSNNTEETSFKEGVFDSKNSFNRRRSSSHNEPRPAEYYSNRQQVKRLWSLPLSFSPRPSPPLPSAAAARVPSTMKSRWYVLAFGAGKVPVKMELNDMKFRQSKKMSSSTKSDDDGRNNQEVAKKVVDRSRNKKGSWPGLLGVLGCSGEQGSSMVKASFVCVPLPSV
ncbi:unnamed protein product [Linum tenue]|uniref:Uncharacterized protein n=1 Tax=Linum tenue TaxID=586396 RepID=A0AAV0JNZ0_9ROSI|nr:unnamed protein product [Linum tenue]